MANLLWFIGAGASAAFGIPTMQKMVTDFEQELKERASQAEIDLYEDVRSFLIANLGRPVDLEAVFSVIDSIISWSPDRVGPSALYHAVRSLVPKLRGGGEVSDAIPRLSTPTPDQVETARTLRQRFEELVRSKCEIPEAELSHVQTAYRTVFERVGQQVGGASWHGNTPVSDWPIFTTNYDPVLERYWVDFAKYPLNTGFSWNEVAGMKVSNPDQLRSGNSVRLFKLHGSITWLNDPDYGLTEQRVVPKDMKKWTGSRFLGQVMLYPIEEKALFVDPYMTMFLQLNRELATTPYWFVIGYSFGDRFIREIFMRNSKQGVRLVLLHPHADQIAKQLDGFKGRLELVRERFGGDDMEAVCQAVSIAFRKG